MTQGLCILTPNTARHYVEVETPIFWRDGGKHRLSPVDFLHNYTHRVVLFNNDTIKKNGWISFEYECLPISILHDDI